MPSKPMIQFGLTIVALTMILAFIDAAWLTHRGNKDGENGAIILGVISFMIFLPFAVVAIWGLKNSEYYTDKVLGHINKKVSDIAEDSYNTEDYSQNAYLQHLQAAVDDYNPEH